MAQCRTLKEYQQRMGGYKRIKNQFRKHILMSIWERELNNVTRRETEDLLKLNRFLLKKINKEII